MKNMWPRLALWGFMLVLVIVTDYFAGFQKGGARVLLWVTLAIFVALAGGVWLRHNHQKRRTIAKTDGRL